MKIFLTIIFGFIAGVVGGMGMGGGTFLIPLFQFLNYGQKSIQAANLLSFLPMAVLALVLHFKNGLVKTKGVGYIIIPAVVFSVVGALVSNSVKPRILKISFGIFFLAMGGFELANSLKNIKRSSKNNKNKPKMTKNK
ncbi:MAG: sulfite exporter TauE/SafE family protein [Clostridia bacterium]|nr:sulfite exporter TauE/SafE family protein [Clostridia bacterium]